MIPELLIGTATLALSFILLNPADIFMPDMTTMLLLGLFLVLFGLFAVFVWRERSLDEREETHRMRAGHSAYLAVSGALALAIAAQSFSHNVDPWLVAAFAVAMLAKSFASYWNRNHY